MGDVYKRQVMALPSGKTSKVKSIVTYDGELDYAFPPQSVTLTLEEDVYKRQEQVKAALENLPADWKTIDLLINNAGLRSEEQTSELQSRQSRMPSSD